MSFVAWVVLGLIAGFLASRLVDHKGQGAVMNVVLGVIGAVAGGWLFTSFGIAGTTEFNVYSLLVATIGAAVLLMGYDAITRSTR